MSLKARMARIKLRPAVGLLHRWAGLVIAGFLFFSGVTGAVISWDHELDELLNSHLTDARAVGPARDTLELARELEARHPEVAVTGLPLSVEAGHSYSFGVEPRVNPATGKLFEPGFNQVFVDPANGAELGKREWGASWPITKETFVSWLYMLHFTLHMPEMWGIDDWGLWLMGGIAMIWTVDCFFGFYLTLPARKRANQASIAASVAPQKSYWQRWKPSWLVRWRSGAYKLNFDLHRAFGLWLWGILFTVAFTAFSLNLYGTVFFPVMSLISNVTPTPFDQRKPVSHHEPIQPKLGFAEILPLARTNAKARGWEQPTGGAFFSPEFGIYSVQFFHPEDGHGAGGVGHRTLFLDSTDGRILGDRQPWKGTAADLFVQAQFPLHSGRILGLPGRILISFTGAVVAMLSVTGVYVWWKKRAARVIRRAPELVGLPAE